MTAELVTAAVTARVTLKPHERHQIARALALGLMTQAQLAEQFGVTRSAIAMVGARSKVMIEEIRRNAADEYAGLWIAQKVSRVAALQETWEKLEDEDRLTAADAVAICREVALETGQIPPRTLIAVVPV